MDDWGWRGEVARWIHKLGHLFYPEEPQDIVIHDSDGNEVFSIAFSGGFVASGPGDPYRVYSRRYADDNDMVGTLEEW